MLPLHKTPDSRSARHQALLKPDNNPSESAVSAHGNSNDLPTCTWVLLKRKLFFLCILTFDLKNTLQGDDSGMPFSPFTSGRAEKETSGSDGEETIQSGCCIVVAYI